MTIVNRGAIPVIMTRGFPSDNINPNKKDIKNAYCRINFLRSDFGEIKELDEIDDWRHKHFSSCYDAESKYWDYFELETFGVQDAKEAWFANYHHNEVDYYIVETFAQTAFAVCDFKEITGKHFDKIVSGETHLVICQSMHGYHETPDRLYQDIIIKYGVDPKNITLQQESHDMLEALEIASYKYQRPKFNLVCGMEMEHFAQQQILLKMTYDNLYPAYPSLTGSLIKNLYQQEPRSLMRPLTNNEWPGFNVDTLQHKDYEKKFLTFNGAYRLQRSLLVHLLAIAGLLDKGLVSYNVMSDSEDTTGKEVYQTYSHVLAYHPEMLKLIKQNRQLIESIDSISLDVDAGETQQESLVGVSDRTVNYYEDSYFSIIAETSFPYYKLGLGDATDIGRILSEKTFKSIGMKHPFILLTNPHALKLLREIGYKTFHPLIDETYDTVKDPVVRICMIINEVKKLCALEGDDLKHFLSEAKKICDYNFHHLLSKKTFHYNLIP